MSLDAILFIIRIIAGIILLGILLSLFGLLWRDYQKTAYQSEVRRRAYGRLIEMIEINGKWTESGDIYPLQPITNIGRAPTNHIVLNNTFTSAEHAMITLRDNQWWLEDRHSRNGTQLNNELINTPVIITNGDVIGVGNISFRISIE